MKANESITVRSITVRGTTITSAKEQLGKLTKALPRIRILCFSARPTLLSEKIFVSLRSEIKFNYILSMRNWFFEIRLDY